MEFSSLCRALSPLSVPFPLVCFAAVFHMTDVTYATENLRLSAHV